MWSIIQVDHDSISSFELEINFCSSHNDTGEFPRPLSTEEQLKSFKGRITLPYYSRPGYEFCFLTSISIAEFWTLLIGWQL
jgi:hypothetical protein